ncbi:MULTISPECIES: TIGR03643 family protein [unclassified Dokdonia]|jgi:uncharacterized protein (TIGR03643 family)|uniref:TIGR03643 family protein n=1 Tax=unclassified Dokdonia TaxID=2615033 RepID=UPI000D5459E5|nr:TIGR03643 family protein [Dokdonia sp. Dokd-P16]AWH73563.1 TIGR03643 family protein [Dokdonia sp. Dokd-P16]|tara:strand:+ start:46266 stop:46565 length:300 start_codon:yes stop_codon:yes gene_type:complete
MKKQEIPEFTERELDRIIEMAWEDRTTFDAIEMQFGIKEQLVIEVMRREMKESSFRMWRKRVQGRKTKHEAKRAYGMDDARFKCSRQKQITHNKISKRR